MSDALAVLAVTRTVHRLLSRTSDATLPGTEVTTKAVDKARDGRRGPQLNLFLYHAAIDPVWRNMDIPSGHGGELGFPPLPLTLHYVVTAYGDDDDDSAAQRLLIAAMRVLHDHPSLGRDELRASLPESDVHRQVERVRITNQILSLDERSKLWTMFQTPCRVSALYEISVVLIESRRPARAPAPVIARGVGDVGVVVRPNLLLPFPTLEQVTPESVGAGGAFQLTGHDLDGDTLQLRFTHPALTNPVITPPMPAPAGRTLSAVLPAGVPAGTATIAAIITKAGRKRPPSNEIPITVRPTVTSALPLTATRDAAGRASLTVGVNPPVLGGQEVLLLAMDPPVRAQPFVGPTSTLTFRFASEAADVPMRLRVGGADSKLIADTVPPSYDPDQRLVVT